MPEIKLTTLTYGGDCLGRLPDGRVVFVPFGLPGELVSVEIVSESRKFARGKLVQVLEPSPDRVEPRCKHFGHCGGCHYQHIAYDAQLHYKTDILLDQLTRVGKLTNLPIPRVQPSPNQYHYRNNLRFHVSEIGKLGFLAPHSERIIPISECHLPELPLCQAWPALSVDAGSGIDQVELRCGMEGDVLVTIEGTLDSPPEFTTEAGISATYAGSGGRVVLAGEDRLLIKVGEWDFQVSGGSFFQVNTPMAGIMVTTLLDNLRISKQTCLMDLYCGVGLFSAFFAGEVKEVIGVELSPDACLDYIVNLDPFNNVSLFEGAAEKVLPALTIKADTVILDPPRAGLHPRVLAALLALNPENIAYVSCDPATLARDLSQITANDYHLEQVFLLDLFPQTYHVETLCMMKRK